MKEEWRPIAGYDGKYEVSSIGRVRSLLLIKNQCNQIRDVPLVLKLQVKGGPYKYWVVTLYRNSSNIKRYVHRLMYQSFVGPLINGQEICHKNGKSLDNRIKNLEQKTPLENTLDKHRHGTMLRGVDLPGSRLNEQKVRDIRKRFDSGESARSLAKEYGVYWRTVYAVIYKESWKHVK